MRDPTVEFDDWEDVLRRDLPKELRRGYREAIVKFRCLHRGKRDTAGSPLAKPGSGAESAGKGLSVPRMAVEAFSGKG